MAVQYFEGVGRRKESSARVRVMSGEGKFIVNDKEAADFFTRAGDLENILRPLAAIGQERGTYDITVLVNGGGVTGQTSAVTLGLTRALVNNAVEGVTKGWVRDLEIVGIGYRAEMKGKGTVVFSLGYSHPIEYPLPTGVEAAVDQKQTRVTLNGIDRQKVGQVAAEMRSLRPPDPYKNKGVRYLGEKLKKKVGKTGAK